MNKIGSPKSHIRFQTPEQLQSFLENESNEDYNFRIYSISGKTDTFRYNINENIVEKSDGSPFEDLGGFICYAFQCDSEGYSGTEYADFEKVDETPF